MKHRSARSLVLTYYRLVAGRIKDSLGYAVGFVDQEGNRGEMSAEDHIKAIEDMGIWGFADHRKNAIHFWHKKKPNKNTHRALVELFAHEIGHLTGKPFKRLKREEQRADEYMLIALCAYDLASQYWRDTKKQNAKPNNP